MAAAYIPTIMTCGDSERDATHVHRSLGQKYNIVFSGFNVESTIHEVPLILSGKAPATLHTEIASNDFTTRPQAIVVGGGYDDEHFAALYNASLEACGGSKKALGVVFVRADTQLTKRLVESGEGPKREDPAYAASMAKRLQSRVDELLGKEGVLEDKFVGEVVRF